MLKVTIYKLVRFFYPFGAIRRILRGPLRGLKFHVAPSMGLSYVLGIDSMCWGFLTNKVRKGSVVFDIGANRGQMGLFFSNAVSSKGAVYCFEPMTPLVNEINRNISLNSIKNINVYPYAISSADGKAEFLFSEAHSTQGKLNDVEELYKTDNTVAVQVQTKTLDSFIRETNIVPKMLKIDVEGAAALVLEGASSLLDRYHPDIYLELHGPEEQQAIGEHLISRDYNFFDMEGNRVEDPINKWCSPIWCTCTKATA